MVEVEAETWSKVAASDIRCTEIVQSKLAPSFVKHLMSRTKMFPKRRR